MRKINSAKKYDEFLALKGKTVTAEELENIKSYFNCTICQVYDAPRPSLSTYLKCIEYTLCAWFNKSYGEDSDIIHIYVERENPLNADDFVFTINEILEKASKQHERLMAFRISKENGFEFGMKSYVNFYNRELNDFHFMAVLCSDMHSDLVSVFSPLVIISLDGYETENTVKDFIKNVFSNDFSVNVLEKVSLERIEKSLGRKELFSSNWVRFTAFEK